MQERIRKQIIVAVLIALASTLHVVESLVPPLPFPGAKLGLANIATLVGLNLLGFWPAVAISVIRSLLGTILGGILLGPSFWMSITGATMSAMTMGAASRLPYFRYDNVALSVVGAITHATAQLLVALKLTNHSGLWGYYPLLLGLSIVTGVFTGISCTKILGLIPRSILWAGRSNA